MPQDCFEGVGDTVDDVVDLQSLAAYEQCISTNLAYEWLISAMRSAWTYSRDGHDACLSQTVLGMFPPGLISKRHLPASHTLLLTIDLAPFNSLEVRPVSQTPAGAFQANVITGLALRTQTVVISGFAMSVWPWCCKEQLRLVADVQHPTHRSDPLSNTTEAGSQADKRTRTTLKDGTSIEASYSGQY